MRRFYYFLLGALLVLNFSIMNDVQAAPFDSVWEEEPNNDPSQADSFENRNYVYGKVDGTDVDFFVINVPYAGNFKFYGNGYGGYNVENYQGLAFSLFDEEGNLITESEYSPPDENGVDSNLIDVILTPGIYYVGVENTKNESEDYTFFTDLRLGVDRLAGTSRYTTAVNIAKAGWEISNYAVITTGGNFPDALSATPLAAKFEAPLLLIQSGKSTMNPEVKVELQRLKAKEVFIVGGQGAVSGGVEQELIKMGIKVTRLSGADRYETAVKVAENVGHQGEVAIATGGNFADALSMSSIAAAKGMPILLTPSQALPPSVKNYLTNNTISHSFVIGGTGAVSEAVKNSLPGSVERISGINRYATNNAIVSRFADEVDFTRTFLATGENYPDALSGSALAAGFDGPIVLTTPNPVAPTIDIIKANNLEIGALIAIGGASVLPNKTITTLGGYTNPNLAKIYNF